MENKTKNIENLKDYVSNITNMSATLILNDTLNNWVPLSNPIITKTDTYYLDNNKYKDFNSETDKKIKLDQNVVYIVVVNKFNHYHHSMVEIVMILQMYLNYFKNVTINNKKICLISERRCWEGKIMGIIFKLFDFKKKMLFIDSDKYYEGNFLYLKHYGGQANIHHIGNILPCFPQENAPIIKELIKKANIKYKNEPIFDKLWISRRNLRYKWNKRYITNMDTIAKILLDNGFKEYYCGIRDPLHQIYLVNKANIIFGESGTGLVNILFSNKNSKLLTFKCPINNWHSPLFNEICASSNVKYCEYKNCEEDKEDENFVVGAFNRPYKVNNINSFKEWFLENISHSNE